MQILGHICALARQGRPALEWLRPNCTAGSASTHPHFSQCHQRCGKAGQSTARYPLKWPGNRGIPGCWRHSSHRFGSHNSWSVHRIYSGNFLISVESTHFMRLEEGLHFTQSAGLIAVHPIADGICDEYPFSRGCSAQKHFAATATILTASSPILQRANTDLPEITPQKSFALVTEAHSLAGTMR